MSDDGSGGRSERKMASVATLVLRARRGKAATSVDLTLGLLGLAELLFTGAKLASLFAGRDLTPETRLFQGIGRMGGFPIGPISMRPSSSRSTS
ncbi:MAG TPA: hypothetical protein VMV83_16630 [Rectinemataceae bacterium]|nr:hypothetical protein [Rectinemataceae bacterium]